MDIVRQQGGKLETLEALRGIAALLVVLYHLQDIFSARLGVLPFAGVFGAGDRGVDLFFVLSGFIISFNHARDVGKPDRVTSYLYKRFSRVMPSVWIMTLVAAVFYAFHFGGVAKEAKLDTGNFLASMFLLPQQQPALVNVTWTLKYEIFFYGLFALAILHRRIGLAALLAWQLAVLLQLAGVLHASHWLVAYYLRPICLEFGIGMLMAQVVAHTTQWSRPARWACGSALVLGLGVVVGGLLDEGLAGRHSLETVRVLVYGVAPGAVILALVTCERTGRLPVPKALVWLGSISYALYLTNFSVLTLTAVMISHVKGLPLNTAALVACVMVAITAGGAFHGFVDAPLQAWLRRHRAPRPAWRRTASLPVPGAGRVSGKA